MNLSAPILSLIVACAAHGQPGRSADLIAHLIDLAAPGSTVRVPAGTYAGHLRVSKAVVLDGGGAAIIDGQGTGTVVELLAPGIEFRGFVVRGSGSGIDGEPAGIRAEAGPVIIENNRVEDALFGIDLRTSPGSIVRDNAVVGKDFELGRRGDGIRLWWSPECVVESNDVRLVRDMVFWYSSDLRISNNRVAQSRYGLHFMYSHDTTVSGNDLADNSVGVYLMYSNGIVVEGNDLSRNRGPSGYGLGLKDCDDIAVRRNRILANRVGAYIDNSPLSFGAVGVLEDNLMAFNEIGMLITPNTKSNVVTGNGFVENEEQVSVHGRGTLEGNQFARDGRGNFWSDYPGFDLDGDHIGDLPYRAVSLFEDLLAREPNLRVLLHSPAQRAIELTARAIPQVQPEPKFTDPFPLMQPPSIGARGATQAGNGWLAPVLLAAAGVLGLAVGMRAWSLERMVR